MKMHVIFPKIYDVTLNDNEWNLKKGREKLIDNKFRLIKYKSIFKRYKIKILFIIFHCILFIYLFWL